MSKKVKVLSYNIHKGNGFFTRMKVLPQIRTFLETIDADIVCLQEVRDYLSSEEKLYGKSQLDFLSGAHINEESAIYSSWNYGKNAIYKKGHHGNAILSKYPTLNSQNFDLTVSKMEYRGLLLNQLDILGEEVYVLCTHLNLRKNDRFKQIKLLENIIAEKIPKGSKIIMVGDFNDFDGSIDKYFQNTHDFLSTGTVSTYPNVLPLFSPDKIFAQNVELANVKVLKDLQLLKMSDHLPILSEINIAKST